MRSLLIVANACVALVGAADQTVSFYSKPIQLRPTEVHNKVDEPIELPPEIAKVYANKSIAVTAFDVDVVERLPAGSHGVGRERSVPLHEAYNHHYIAFIGSKDGLWRLYNDSTGVDPIGGKCVKADKELLGMKTDKVHRAGLSQFGGGSGAEFRNNPHNMPSPYVFVLQSPTHFASVLHLINTKHEAAFAPGRTSSPLLECPCTPQRHFDLAKGTIDGCAPRPPFRCSDELIAQRNAGCELELYVGGYRCCEHGVFLTDTVKHDVERGPLSTFYLKFAVTFREHDPAQDRELHPTTCCDATMGRTAGHEGEGVLGANVEYDVPQCPKGTPPEGCIHVTTSVAPIDLTHDDDPDELVELVYAVGHMHVGGMYMDLIDDLTGQVVCRATPTYGTSTQAGDEEGYLVGIQPCVWGSPPLNPPMRFKRSHPMRTVAYYNSTTAHTGVMSLWLMQAAKLPAAPAPSNGAAPPLVKGADSNTVSAAPTGAPDSASY